MHLLIVVPFLNEERLLPTFLESVAQQDRLPDHLVLVDDGSTDRSADIAAAFCRDHDWADDLRRPARPSEDDRLATAAELKAFRWGLEQVDNESWDVVAKMDGDLELRPNHLASIVSALEQDPRIGICGAYLSYRAQNGRTVRERHPPDHVRGPNKFYRRGCFEQVFPIPEILGWDGFDDVKARMLGWETLSIPLDGGDSIHLRPTGTHGGSLRANRRWGLCACANGSHPLFATATGIARMRTARPFGLAGANFILGYFHAMAKRTPRAEPAVVRQRRREERERVRQRLYGVLRRG